MDSMANVPDSPWTPYEKKYLLAEILKTHLPLDQLVQLVRSSGINGPALLDDVALPPNRSINSSRQMLQDLLSPQLSYQRSHPLSQPPNILGHANPFNKRPLPHDSGVQQYNRVIMPKPPPSGHFSPQSHPDPPSKRKRGRPSKAETKAREEQARVVQEQQRQRGASATSFATSATPGVPQMTVTTTRSATTPPPPVFSPAVAEEVKPIGPITSRGMAISSIVTPTHGEEEPSPRSNRSSGSSGNRKVRGRSKRTGPEDTPIAGTMGERRAYAPIAAAQVTSEEASAVAAVSRHRSSREREEPAGSRGGPSSASPEHITRPPEFPTLRRQS